MRKFITAGDIDMIKALGRAELHINPNDTVTDIAREHAARLGIKISVITQTAPEFPPEGGPLPVIAALADSPAPSTSVRAPIAASAPAPSGYDINHWRRKFPILKKYIHVANCSQAPQSDYTREACEAYLESWNSMGMDWERWIEEIQRAKAEFAKLINADVSCIAIGTSVSELTSAVASALPFDGPRRKVVATEAEFPTVGHVWLGHRKYGARVEFVPVENDQVHPAAYDRYLDEQTLIASICDVYYYNGFKQDLSLIIPKIHACGALVYLDAYQGIGTHPIDVTALDIDFLASGNLKYLLGIPGIAFLYVKKELIPYLHPACTGWFGQENPFAFDIKNLDYAMDARRFDNGTPPVMAAYVARGGMRMINEIGVENIEAWTNCLSAHCIEQARQRGLEVASPTNLANKAPSTAIRVPGDSHAVESALKAKGIIASARSDVIRIAPHFFTRRADIDYVLDCLAEILNSQQRSL